MYKVSLPSTISLDLKLTSLSQKFVFMKVVLVSFGTTVELQNYGIVKRVLCNPFSLQ